MGRKSAVLLVAALMFGCGGGGTAVVSPPQPEQTQTLALGLVRGDAPTDLLLVVTKPFPEAGTLDLAATPEGPFAAVGLPAPVAASERCTVWVTFTPPGGGGVLQHGAVPLVFRSGSDGTAYPVKLHLDAEVEVPSARLLQSQLALGNVPIGETVPCGIHFENTSAVTPVTVTSLVLSGGDFSFARNVGPVPVEVAPGSTYLVRLLYTPPAETIASSLLRVFHSAAAEPLEATLEAKGIPPHIVVDYGTVALDPATGESPWLTLDVGPDAVSILLEAWGDPLALIDLVGFEGPSGKVYETADLSGPLDWLSGRPAGAKGLLNVSVPDSLLPDVQLEPGGGAYRFRLRHESDVSALAVRATITQRRQGRPSEGTLDVAVFLAKGLVVTDPSDPMSDAKMATVMKTIDAILGARGVRLGKITFHPVAEPIFDVLGSDEDAERLLGTHSPLLQGDRTLSLVFVKAMTYGVTGVAGAAPGSWSQGMPWSGVAVAYDTAQGTGVGVAAAHQISHYLGWLGTTVLPSEEEADTLERHAILHPGLPAPILAGPGHYLQAQATAASIPSPTGWCDICARTHAR
jgi:hypothetical protein